MKFAFLIMGPFQNEQAEIHGGSAQIIGVPNLDSACETAKRLLNDGIECIELCGAFGPEGAKRVIEATGNQIPVGFVTHLPEQNDIFHRVFGE